MTGRTLPRALVTGGTKGIGAATADRLVEAGYDVTVVARSTSVASEALPYKLLRADLGTDAGMEKVVAACDGIDLLVNNAGSIPFGGIDELSMDQWRSGWELKVFGYIALTQAAFRSMKRQRYGAIVNIIGAAGEDLDPRYLAGSTGNAALIAFTKAVALESAASGVRVLGINPGFVMTDRTTSMVARIATDAGRQVSDVEAKMPFGRFCQPSEVANLVAFAASPAAAYLSGAIISLDGGFATTQMLKTSLSQ